MPALPPDAAAAEAAGPEVALAFSIEALRRRHDAPELRPLFLRSLSALIARALRSVGGDPAFQAAVLARQERAVADYIALTAQGAADRRRVRAAIDAFAHPGKLRRHAGALPDALAQLHASAQAGNWSAVRSAAQSLAGTGWAADSGPLLTEPALARLERAAQLREDPAVQRYLTLSAARGPLATGEESARAGAMVEEETARAFQQIADRLDAAGPSRHRVAQGLRPRSGLQGATHGAKDEWDAALLRTVEGTDALAVVLLAEAKASPSSAVSDWPRLRRGLQRLAQVPAGIDPVFSCSEGELRVQSDSLRALAPPECGLPAQVIYCCTGQETRTPLLSAPARAMLLQQPAAIAYAGALARGEASDPGLLAPVWEALPGTPQLRPVLEQYETARSARAAMLHPEDLRQVFA